MPRKIGNAWQANAMVNGRRVRPHFPTYEEAVAFEENPYAVLGVSAKHDEIGKLFPALAKDRYQGKPNAKDAFRITDELIRRLGAQTSIKDINRRTFRTLIDDLKEIGNKPQTINNKMSILSGLLSYAVEEGILDEKPTCIFQAQTRGRIRELSPDEEEAILSRLNPGDLHFALFLGATGCRPSEARRTRWEDYTSDAVTFWHTKTSQPRTVPLTAQAKEAIAHFRYAAGSNGNSGPFAGIVYQTFLLHWRKAKTAVGLGEDSQVTPYVLRHTVATRLARAGMDPIRLSKWMGHTDMQMTRRYTQLNVNDLLDGVRTLERTTRLRPSPHSR